LASPPALPHLYLPCMFPPKQPLCPHLAPPRHWTLLGCFLFPWQHWGLNSRQALYHLRHCTSPSGPCFAQLLPSMFLLSLTSCYVSQTPRLIPNLVPLYLLSLCLDPLPSGRTESAPAFLNISSLDRCSEDSRYSLVTSSLSLYFVSVLP
jgi:hypothetical protein